MQRIFLVGCPRSGTTFVQATLARHPQIFSLPETSFFENILLDLDRRVHPQASARPVAYHRNGWLVRTRSRRRARAALTTIAAGLGSATPTFLRCWSLQAGTQALVDMLDHSAAAQGCQAWLEKTPNHVHYVEEIRRYVPGVKFIHLLRNGEDVIASTLDAVMRYGNRGAASAFDRGLSWWVDYWNRAMTIHRACVGQPEHCFVFYEDLVADFENERRRLCKFIGVDSDCDLQSAQELNFGEEPWLKSAVSGRLLPARPKFDALFGPKLQQWMRSHLLDYGELRAEFLATQALR
ncbi:sulfotransferase family protein [Pseudolysobacter antarcticus]|nr:sulfotransferase [Pseudolysobacter antarcticus]